MSSSASSEPLADARRPQRAARGRTRGRRPPRAAGARPGGDARAGAPPHGAHHERTALPPAFDPSRPARRPRDASSASRPACSGHPLRHLDGHHRPARRDRARRRGGGARARARRRLDLGQRRRRARRCGALRARRALAIAVAICVVQWSAHRRPIHKRALQHRHAHALVARGGLRLHARLRPGDSPSSSPSARASSPGPSTSRSTRACCRSHSPSRDARGSGASGTSASSGSRRTTSSTASSAA